MKFSTVKKEAINYLYDHPILKLSLEHSYMIFITILSAIIFSFGFKTFISPNYNVFYDFGIDGEVAIRQLASTGASGISQIFVEILKLCGLDWIRDGEHQYIMNFVFYLGVNIPLAVFSWFKISKKFTIYTLLNCAFVTLFGILLPTGSPDDFLNQIARDIFDQPVARVLFAGTCTGLASALAYSINSCAGGIDVIAYYISEKKSSPVGKFSAYINAGVISVFTILSVIPGGIIEPAGSGGDFEAVRISTASIIVMFTFLYMIVTTLVVDTLDTQNKKVSLQIFTKNENLSQIIMSNIPHGCTICQGEGGFTGDKMFVIYMSVRKNEAKKVVALCRKADPNSFINALATEQIYGKFHRQPID